MNSPRPIRALLLLNNPISADLAEMALERDGIAPEEVALITLRRTSRPWFDRCAHVVHYPAAPSLKLAGQWRFAGFYRRAARLLRSILSEKTLREVYIVNNDNLLTNHVLAAHPGDGGPRVTVVAEGLMNYQDIQPRNRAGWRHRTKRVLAGMLGLGSKPVEGHLSGSFDPAVSRVVSFEPGGLFAPPAKVVTLPFRPVTPKVSPRADTLLYVETALWQWMQPSDWEPLARAFAAWIHARNRPRLLIKTHPSYPACPLLRSLLPPFEVVYPGRSIEQVAPEIDAGEVVGTCCTGLVTLRFLRPDISIVDLGSDIYIPKAYHGDWSSVELMRRVGVKVIASADSPVVKEKSEGHSTGVNPSAGRRT